MAKFVVYEKVAEAVWQRIDKSKASDGTQTAVNLGSGLVAGMAAAVISQPADTMLSKINKTKGLPGEGTTSRLIKIAKELGVRGAFTGINTRLFMVGTLTAFQFAIYGDGKFPSRFPTFCQYTDNHYSQEGTWCYRRCRDRQINEPYQRTGDEKLCQRENG